MSRSVIVAVGGTGQMVLHYYVQLFQIGAISDPFHAIVVDSDRMLPSLESVRSFWQLARTAHPEPSNVPRIDYFPVAENVNGHVIQAVAGAALVQSSAIHPAEAFFDYTSLQQDVKEGLYARPALSAVMQTDWGRFPLASFTGFQRGMVVGSLIGGTGGGLIAPLLNELAARIRSSAMAEQPKLKALLFGEYFQLTGTAPVRDAAARYPSNKLLVAHCLKELAPSELEHFVFVEPKVLAERQMSKEREPVHLEWPDQNHPLWIGISALEELRTNTAWPNSPGFKDKERGDISIRDLSADKTALNDSIGIAKTVASRAVLAKIPNEPWFSTFFGRALPRLLSAAYSVAKNRPALSVNNIKVFCRDIQDEYVKQWQKLSDVFPGVSGTGANPARLREVQWGELKREVSELTDSKEKLVSITSALILYRALRGGRE